MTAAKDTVALLCLQGRDTILCDAALFQILFQIQSNVFAFRLSKCALMCYLVSLSDEGQGSLSCGL